MRDCFVYLFCLALTGFCQVKSSNEILNILNTTNDLTLQEVNALRPLFTELQKQYDAIKQALASEGLNDIVPWQKEAIPEPEIAEYISLLEGMLKQPAVEKLGTLKYDTKLPTFEQLMADTPIQTAGMTEEQIEELADLQQIMQEVLDEAQNGINGLVQRALHIESEMFKLNKPKIVEHVLEALSVLFRFSAQLRRAAYCVYSNIPQLNASLQNLNAGVECYVYSKNLLNTVEQEVVRTVGAIKKHVFNLVKIYKKIAAKHSIVGKIVTATLNILNVLRDIHDILDVASKAVVGLENQLPNAASKSVNCAKDFAETLPFMLETTTNVTVCITYVDPMKEQFEFLLPEAERNLKLDDLK